MNTYFEFWCQPCNNQGHLVVMIDILKQYIFRNNFILINRIDWLMEPRFKNDHLGKNHCFPNKREKIDL